MSSYCFSFQAALKAPGWDECTEALNVNGDTPATSSVTLNYAKAKAADKLLSIAGFISQEELTRRDLERELATNCFALDRFATDINAGVASFFHALKCADPDTYHLIVNGEGSDSHHSDVDLDTRTEQLDVECTVKDFAALLDIPSLSVADYINHGMPTAGGVTPELGYKINLSEALPWVIRYVRNSPTNRLREAEAEHQEHVNEMRRCGFRSIGLHADPDLVTICGEVDSETAEKIRKNGLHLEIVDEIGNNSCRWSLVGQNPIEPGTLVSESELEKLTEHTIVKSKINPGIAAHVSNDYFNNILNHGFSVEIKSRDGRQILIRNALASYALTPDAR